MNGNPINGVINIYKEKGYTSHDVVAKMRGILKTKKIGHTGTLDPDAEGVLPVCVGNATKLCELLMEKQKEYAAELILGKQTDTQDISGTVLEESDSYQTLSEEEIRQAILSFVGEYDQIPPMYSALKVNGKKLYELARNGIEVERKARNVYIYNVEIERICIPTIHIRVTCSKGTYIRTLCHDIGMKLGTFGCMGNLCRTKTGKFALEESIKLAELEELVSQGKLEESGVLIPTDEVLLDYPALFIQKTFFKLLDNGNPLMWDMFSETDFKKSDGNLYRVYDMNHKFVAVYRYYEKENILKPEKMFK